MSTDAFEKTNWNWQLSMLQQKVGEWVEYQFSRLQGSVPGIPDGLSISPWLIELLKFLFWLVLGLFLVWLGWRLWREFNPYLYSWLARASNTTVASSREISINQLLTQSQEFAYQGNYREACRCLYLAMLQQLHEKAIAIQQPSRTDGEYLHLLKSTVTPIQPYETLITLHERICFDNAQMLADNYQQCRQAYQEIIARQP